jgi:NAD(P)-dependent dehydrogenase (short-subunit alcohol dehydrogenase family)
MEPDRDGSLEGAHALVTGGGTGIGFGIAAALAGAGAVVTIAGRRLDVLEDAAERLRARLPGSGRSGSGVRAVRCDVTIADDVARAVEAAAADDGSLDIAVANAGSAVPGPFLLVDEQGWRACCELNIIGTASTFRHAALRMARGGSLVAISTAASSAPEVAMSAYTATKAGVDMLVKAAAWELGPRGIRVNAIQPGYVATDAVGQAFSEDLVTDLLDRTALGRAGEPGDIAATVLHLVTPAGRWITGQVIGVDGGMSVQPMADLREISERLYGVEAVTGALGPRAQK